MAALFVSMIIFEFYNFMVFKVEKKMKNILICMKIIAYILPLSLTFAVLSVTYSWSKVESKIDFERAVFYLNQDWDYTKNEYLIADGKWHPLLMKRLIEDVKNCQVVLESDFTSAPPMDVDGAAGSVLAYYARLMNDPCKIGKKIELVQLAIFHGRKISAKGKRAMIEVNATLQLLQEWAKKAQDVYPGIGRMYNELCAKSIEDARNCMYSSMTYSPQGYVGYNLNDFDIQYLKKPFERCWGRQRPSTNPHIIFGPEDKCIENADPTGIMKEFDDLFPTQ